MFRALATAATLFLVSFAAEALPPNFDRTLCVTAVMDASKVTQCVAEAVKARKDKGEIYSAVTTCGMYAVPDRRLACYEYAIDHLETIDREEVRGACAIIAKPNFKGTCYKQHLIDQFHQINLRAKEDAKRQAPAAPARGQGSAR